MRGETESGKKGSEKLLEAIGELPEEMVAEAADLERIRRIYEKNRRRRVLYAGRGLAAAALIGIVMWGIYIKGGTPSLIQKENLTEKKAAQNEIISEETNGNQQEESSDVQWNEDISGDSNSIEELGIRFFSADAGKEAAQKDDARKKSIDEADNYSSGDSAENLYNESRVPLYTVSSGQGKERMIQTEMILGELGEEKKYTLTASQGISFLAAAPLDENGEVGNKRKILEKIRKYECSSGTQLTLSLPVQTKRDSDIAALIPAQIQETWEENGIRAVGYIKVCMEEGEQEERKGIIFIGKWKGKYYTEIFL